MEQESNPLTLKIGKRYIDKNGQLSIIEANPKNKHNGGMYTFMDQFGCTYTEHGNLIKGHPGDGDLIEEVN